MERATIGKFIAALRKDAGMTQKQLAEILNVSDKTISHWERDESSPDLSMIPIIAQVFGVTCDELLKGEKKQEEKQQAEVKESVKQESATEKIEKKVKHFFENELTLHKILCAVAAGLSALALLKVEQYVFQIGSVPGITHDLPGFFGFAFFFSVFKYYVISLVMLCVSHINMKNKNADDTKEENKTGNMLIANKYTAYSGIFTCLSVLTALVQLIMLGNVYYNASLLILFPTELIAVIVTVVLLKRFNLIAGKPRRKQSKEDFRFRLFTIIFTLIFAACGVGAQLCIGYFESKYGLAETFFINESFIEYMETYKPFPAEYKDKLMNKSSSLYELLPAGEKDGSPVFDIKAPLSDYDEMTYENDEDTNQAYNLDDKKTLSPVDSYLYEHPEINEKDYEPIYRLFGSNFYDDSEKTIEFRWRNHEVKYFETTESLETIHVYTYETAHYRDIINKVNDITYHLAFIYYPALVVICVIMCIAVPRRRRKRLTRNAEDEAM